MADDDTWGGHDVYIHNDVEFEWTDAAGNTHKEKATAGDRYSFKGPCDTAGFLRGLAAADKSYSSKSTADSLDGLDAMCAAKSTTDTVLGETPEVHPGPAGAPAVPHQTGKDAAPKPDEDAKPDSVSAPEPDVAATVESQPKQRGEPAGRPPEEKFHDPRSGGSEAELVDQLREKGLPSDQLDDARDRVLRNEPTPGLPHYHFGRNNTPKTKVVADPIDLFHGAYFLTVVDCRLPSPGVPLELVRTYRSGMPFYGPWGFNWDHNYNMFVRPLLDGNAAVWTGHLSEEVYRVQADGTFEPPLGIPRRLTYQPAAIAAGESYTLEDRDGLQRHFERPPGWPNPERLPLVRIQDRNGNGHDVAYDADGHVARVEDGSGRAMIFAYGECGLLEQLADHTGRRWVYAHDMDAAHLVAAVGPPTPDMPDGAMTRYEYEDKAADHPLLRHNLTRLIDPDDRPVVINEYEQDPDSDDFARVVTQHYGCARADFRATKLQDLPRIASAINLPAQRVETMIDGVYRVYTFNFRGDLLDERFRLVRDESYRLWAKVHEYDDFGNQTLDREPDGLSLRREYDASNPDPRGRANVLRVLREAPPTAPLLAQVLMEIEYEPRFNQPRRITDGAGHAVRYAYDYEADPAGTGNLVRIEQPAATLPDGTVQHAVERLHYRADGQVLQRTTAAGWIIEHRYFGPGPNEGLLREVVRDPGGLALTESYDYDAWGNGVELTDGNGSVTRLEYDASGLLRSLRLPGMAVAHRYEYDKSGHLRRSLMPRGSYADAVITGDAIVSTFEHNALGQLVAEVACANTVTPRSRAYRYDAWGRLVNVIDALGREKRVAYDERGEVLEESEGLPNDRRSHRYVYDRNGNRTAAIEAGGRRTEFRPNPWGAHDRVRFPAPGGGWTVAHLSYGRSDVLLGLSISGRPGPGLPATTLFETTIEYDERQRPRSGRRQGHEATLWWNADGDLERDVDVAGNETSYSYDAAGRLWRIDDAGGNALEYTYDAADRLVQVLRREPRHNGGVDVSTTQYGYDARGNVSSTTDALGNVTRSEFDDRGLSIAIVDPLGRRIELDYDAAGLMVGRRSVATGIACAWVRDLGGRVTVFRDPLGAETRYDLNAFDQVVSQRYPDGSIHGFDYAPTGELQGETTPGGTTISYTLDASGEVERLDAVPGAGVLATPAIIFERDGLGRIVRALQAGLTVERGYDQLGRIVLDSVAGRRFERNFDDVGSSFSLTYPDGRRDRIRMDGLRRITSIELDQRGTSGATGALAPGTVLASYAYDGLNRLAERKLFNGVVSSYAYDPAGRLVHLSHASGAGAPFNDLRNVYDGLGLRRVRLQTPAPQRSTFSVYDPLSRMTATVRGIAAPAGPLPITQAQSNAYVAALGPAPAGDETQQFELNAADVRLTARRIDAAGTTVATYSSNALRQIGNVDTVPPGGGHQMDPLGWDGDGRRSSDTGGQYGYNALGQLLEVRDPANGSLTLTQRFDPLGRLIEWAGPGGVGERLDWFEGRRVGRNPTPAGTAEQQSWSAMPEESAVLSNGANRWAVQDDRFSMLTFGAEDGSLLERYSYDPFGAPRVFAADGVTPRTLAAAKRRPVFAGLELVTASLYSGKQRVYDPTLGQFLQRDPAGYGDSSSLYTYCAHDPLDNIDVDGRLIEAAWDLASLGLGVYSAVRDWRDGRWGWFALDVVGSLLDTVALLLPFVPGGVGATIKAYRAGTLAVASGANTWRTGRIVIPTSPTALRIGRLAFKAETVVRGGQAIDQALHVGQGFYNSIEQFGEGNYLAAMASLAMAGVGARGALAKWYDMPRVRSVLNAAERPFYPAGVDYPIYDKMPWRAFGNRLEMIRNPKVKYRPTNLFHDDRISDRARAQYWERNASGRADGSQLQHTWFMDSDLRFPQWLRNAGLNLVEVPGRLNSWMGHDVWRNRLFRFHVGSLLGVAAGATFETTQYLAYLLSGGRDRGATGGADGGGTGSTK
jgi:RHS repeat-associated protein